MEDDFYYGELPELPPPVANTAPELVDEDDNPVENPDLELGWLKNETKTVHHDAVEGVKKVSHYEVNLKPDGTPAIYYDANGKEYGRDVHEVIDVPGVQARDAFNVAKTMLLGTGCGMYDVIRIVNTGTAALTVSPGANLIVRKLS